MSKPRGRQKKQPTQTNRGVEPLQGRNVLLHGRQRTSMRLEPSMWGALEEITRREGLTINDLCSRIDSRLQEQARLRGVEPSESEVTLTSGVRVFIFAYFRAAATDSGHMAAGHGMGDPFVGTPFDIPSKDDDGDGGQTPKDGGGPSSAMPGGETQNSAPAAI